MTLTGHLPHKARSLEVGADHDEDFGAEADGTPKFGPAGGDATGKIAKARALRRHRGVRSRELDVLREGRVNGERVADAWSRHPPTRIPLDDGEGEFSP